MFSGTHIPKHKSPSISELCFVNPTVSRMELKGKEETLFWGAPKSLQMVTAAMKLKDAYSLEEKL